MKNQDYFIPQLQQEVALTETFLKRIPQDKLDWKPHKKSMSIRELANHLAEIPSWITGTMKAGEMDLSGYKPADHGTIDEIIKELKSGAAEAEKALQKPDDEYERMWKMTNDGEIIFEMPKFKLLQSNVMNQFPHHRAQLGVYFRLLDISVPATYGPSADESE